MPYANIRNSRAANKTRRSTEAAGDDGGTRAVASSEPKPARPKQKLNQQDDAESAKRLRRNRTPNIEHRTLNVEVTEMMQSQIGWQLSVSEKRSVLAPSAPSCGYSRFPMLVHTVYFWLKPEITAAQRADF